MIMDIMSIEDAVLLFGAQPDAVFIQSQLAFLQASFQKGDEPLLILFNMNQMLTSFIRVNHADAHLEDHSD